MGSLIQNPHRLYRICKHFRSPHLRPVTIKAGILDKIIYPHDKNLNTSLRYIGTLLKKPLLRSLDFNNCIYAKRLKNKTIGMARRYPLDTASNDPQASTFKLLLCLLVPAPGYYYILFTGFMLYSLDLIIIHVVIISSHTVGAY